MEKRSHDLPLLDMLISSPLEPTPLTPKAAVFQSSLKLEVPAVCFKGDEASTVSKWVDSKARGQKMFKEYLKPPRIVKVVCKYISHSMHVW